MDFLTTSTSQALYLWAFIWFIFQVLMSVPKKIIIIWKRIFFTLMFNPNNVCARLEQDILLITFWVKTFE